MSTAGMTIRLSPHSRFPDRFAAATAAAAEEDSISPMGKFTRKPNLTLDVAVMDSSRSSLGVLTRAKTLALQRLQPAAPPPPDPDVSYLELRSRRLQKRMQRRNSLRGCACGSKAGVGGGEELCFRSVIGAEGLGTEPPLGGNDLYSDASDRAIRESTPCNLIGPADTITAPSSTTKKTHSSQAASQNVRNVNSPSMVELEEFFNREEQLLQRHFIDKYNFDIINDLPLPGRYEWVAR